MNDKHLQDCCQNVAMNEPPPGFGLDAVNDAAQLGKWLEKRLCVLESEAYDAAIEILNGDWKKEMP